MTRTAESRGTYKLQDDLLGGLSLLPKDGLCLSTETLLFAIVTPLSLGNQRILALLVLRNFVGLVAAALGPLAESIAQFRHVHHFAWVRRVGRDKKRGKKNKEER